jgi:hypothetical protein
MARKQAKTKRPASRPAVKRQKSDKVAYEVWLTKKANHGSMEDQLAAEGLLLKDLQGRGGPKRSKPKAAKRKTSK